MVMIVHISVDELLVAWNAGNDAQEATRTLMM